MVTSLDLLDLPLGSGKSGLFHSPPPPKLSTLVSLWVAEEVGTQGRNADLFCFVFGSSSRGMEGEE